MPEVKTQVAVTFSATGASDYILMRNPGTLIIPASPAGSTVKLQVSKDLSAWYDLPDAAGNSIAYTTKTSQPITIHGHVYLRLNCTVYGGTPFVCWLDAPNFAGT